LSLVAGAVALTCNPAHPDVITDWNITALGATEALSPQAEIRALAMTHAAMFDAVNAITRSHTPIIAQPSAPDGSSVEAAAASAAHAVLLALLPARKAALDNALNATLAKVTNEAARDSGSAVGREVAEKVGAARSADGSDRKPEYTPGRGAGQWQPAAPHNLPFATVIWADVKPWVLKANDEVQAPGPLPLDGEQYAREIDEVRRLGARDSKERSADQTAAAIFSLAKPMQIWSAAARAAVTNGTSVIENARIFALMNVAAADATITGWAIKRQYPLWRPVAAIRGSGKDGDANWESLLNTPAHPDYVSGHCLNSGAAAQVLRHAYKGEGVPFTAMYGSGGSGLTRSFSGFTQAEKEIGDARVWGGVHTRTADDHGALVGHKVAELVMQRAMQPLVVKSASTQ
jgi:hypothetical protein